MGSLIGFALAAIVLIAGIVAAVDRSGTIVVNQRGVQKLPFNVQRPGLLVAAVLAAPAVYCLVAWSLVVVPGAHVGCIYDPLQGGIQSTALPEGLRFKPPWAKVQTFSIQTQEYTMSSRQQVGAVIGDDSIKCETNEGLKVLLDLTAMFHIDAERAPMLWRTLGANYDRIFVRPMVRELIRMVVAKYSVQQVYSGRRDEIEQEITRRLKKPFENQGLVLEQILLRNVAYAHPEFADAIAEKQARQQDVIAEKRKLEKAEFQKQATVNEAKGEAKSIKLRAETLAENPEVVKYNMAQKIAPRVRKAYLSEDRVDLPLGGDRQ